MNELSMLGEKSLWQLPKTAFLCSDKFSAGSVLKSYDWAGEIYQYTFTPKKMLTND
jgi:hypothetical protein